MGKSFYIIIALVGFLAGVGLYLVVQPSIYLLLGVGLVCLLVLVGDAYMRPLLPTKSPLLSTKSPLLSTKSPLLSTKSPTLVLTLRAVLIILALFVLAGCMGLLRASFAEHRISPTQVDYYNGQKVEIEGVIVETDVRRDKAKYTIASQKLKIQSSKFKDELQIRSQKSQIEISGDVLISLEKYPQYHYGDRVRISGDLQEPGEFDGFSYSNYLSRYGVYSVMYRPWVTVIGEGEGNLFWRSMGFLQNKFLERINQIFPEPHASFEAGLLVGARKGIPPDLMEKFNITGLTHIIAISGYNITIIIVFVMWILKGIPRRIGFLVAIISIILFTLFVGASPAVVRASIMGILGLIALNYGRQNNIHITVLFSAFFMVLWNPKILWWDVGFQLSFAAVLGLIYVAPLFDKYANKLPEAFGMREAIQMTLSAQVMALPIIILNFERLSIIAPLSNLLVIFAIPLAMLFGFLAVIFSFVFNGISLVLGYITWGILSYIIWIIEFMSRIPYASIDIPGMKLWMMFGYYLLLILLLRQRYLALKQEDINRS